MKNTSPLFYQVPSITSWLVCLVVSCYVSDGSAQWSDVQDMSHLKKNTQEMNISQQPGANILVHWKDGKVQAFGNISDLRNADRAEDVVAVGIQYAGLREVPFVLRRFPNITLLDLSHNNLSCEAIAEWGVPRSLKRVYLNDNPLNEACQQKLKSRHPRLQFIFAIDQLTQKPE